MSYEDEFNIFSRNINIAARSFYYHQEINNQVHEDCRKYEYPQYSPLFQALDANAQFWNDYKYQSILYSIIILGTIFDKNKNSHGIKSLVKKLKKSNLFTKEKLRERKLAQSSEAPTYIDSYMDKISEFTDNDYCNFLRYIVKTRMLWRKVKGVRNKIYAHQDKLDSKKKAEILEKAQYGTINEIISRLLTVERFLWEAFNNGKKQDPSYKNKDVYNRVKDDTTALLSRLSKDFIAPL